MRQPYHLADVLRRRAFVAIGSDCPRIIALGEPLSVLVPDQRMVMIRECRQIQEALKRHMDRGGVK